MAVGDEHAVDKVLFLHAGCRLAATTAPLGLVAVHRLGLGVAAVGEGNHAVLLRDQVLKSQVDLGLDDLCAARIAELAPDVLEFRTNDLGQATWAAQDLRKLMNCIN